MGAGAHSFCAVVTAAPGRAPVTMPRDATSCDDPDQAGLKPLIRRSLEAVAHRRRAAFASLSFFPRITRKR